MGYSLKNSTENQTLPSADPYGTRSVYPERHRPLAFTTDALAEVDILERTDLTTFTTIRRRVRKFQENKGDDAARR